MYNPELYQRRGAYSNLIDQFKLRLHPYQDLYLATSGNPQAVSYWATCGPLVQKKDCNQPAMCPDLICFPLFVSYSYIFVIYLSEVVIVESSWHVEKKPCYYLGRARKSHSQVLRFT